MNRPAPETEKWRFFFALGRGIHLTWPVLSIILAVQVALGLLIGFIEGWSVGDSIYFTFITGLTIGYGDVVPRQAIARACDWNWCRRTLTCHSSDFGPRHATVLSDSDTD